MQLTEEGLLVKEPYKGLRVRSISQNELSDLNALRIALETLAFEQAWDRCTPEALMDRAQRNLNVALARARRDLAGSVEYEVVFHSWVYELSDNGLLLTHWEKLEPLLQIYFSVYSAFHGVEGTFMSANLEYLELSKGSSLEAPKDQIKNKHLLSGDP